MPVHSSEPYRFRLLNLHVAPLPSQLSETIFCKQIGTCKIASSWHAQGGEHKRILRLWTGTARIVSQDRDRKQSLFFGAQGTFEKIALTTEFRKMEESSAELASRAVEARAEGLSCLK